MTVQSTEARVSYTISGAGPYTIPFMFLDDEDLLVYNTPADGSDPTVLALTADYTVTGAGEESGGELTLVSPIDGDSLIIINDPEILQLTDYPEVGKFPAAAHERALDRLTIIAKRVFDLADRSFRLNDASTASSLEFPSPAAGQLIGWDVDGALINTSPSGVGPSGIGTTELANESVTLAKLGSGSKLFHSVVTMPAGAFYVTADHQGMLIVATNASSGSVNLPAIASVPAGFMVGIINNRTGGTRLSLNPNGLDQIDTYFLQMNESALVVHDGTTIWKTIGLTPKQVILAPVQLLNTTGVTFSGLPFLIDEMTLTFEEVSLNGTDAFKIEINDNGSWVDPAATWGGNSYVNMSSVCDYAEANSLGGVLAADVSFGVINIKQRDSWSARVAHITGQTFVEGATDYNKSITMAVSLASITGIRIVPTGANTFDGGTVQLSYTLKPS